jgi:hypothetical protein
MSESSDAWGVLSELDIEPWCRPLVQAPDPLLQCMCPGFDDMTSDERIAIDVMYGHVMPRVRTPSGDLLTLEETPSPCKARKFANRPRHALAALQIQPGMEEMLSPRDPNKERTSTPESPRTPTTKAPLRSCTPPVFRRKLSNPGPKLLQALRAKSLDRVKAALHQNPTEAQEPFWDHDCEPPLCAAVRLECCVGIVKLLLEHGADPEAQNVRGRTPAQLLEQIASTWALGTNHNMPTEGYGSEVEIVLNLPSWVAGTNPFSTFPAELEVLGWPAHSNKRESWSHDVATLLEGRV